MCACANFIPSFSIKASRRRQTGQGRCPQHSPEGTKKRCPLLARGPAKAIPLRRRPTTMKYNVVVATHHKTGTVWMDGVFKNIARDVGVQYIDFRSQHGCLDEALRKPFILLNCDSNFREYSHILDRDDV